VSTIQWIAIWTMTAWVLLSVPTALVFGRLLRRMDQDEAGCRCSQADCSYKGGIRS
jgi:hypothetical protein